MRKDIILPAVTLAGGAAGFALRKWQLAEGFEADTRLAIDGAPSATALLVWTAAMAAVIVALCWGKKERLTWDRAFAGAGGNTLYMTAMVVSGILLVCSAGMEVIAFPAAYQSSLMGDTWGARVAAMLLPPLRIVLCLGALPSIIFWARPLYRGEGGRGESLSPLELCLLYCVWLISDYQTRAADPVTMDYLYEVLAIAVSLLGLYFLSGYSFLKEGGRPRRTVAACLLGAYLSLVTMADGHSMADLLRCAFAVVFLTAHAALLLQEHPAGEDAPAVTEETENG